MPAKRHNDIISNSMTVIPVGIRVAVFHDNEFKDAILKAEKNHLVVPFSKFRSGSMSRIDTMNSETAISYNQTIIDAFLAC